MPTCHLILGGARSGKSRFAEETAKSLYQQRKPASLIYLATATAGDTEMASRIAHHQKRRGSQWHLIEEPIDIASVVSQASVDTTILIDCLTLWLSNCLHKQCWPQKKEALIEALHISSANVILVSNEVGSGIVPLGELSRQFVDESGRLHQQIASIANDVTLIVAGLSTALKRSTD